MKKVNLLQASSQQHVKAMAVERLPDNMILDKA